MATVVGKPKAKRPSSGAAQPPVTDAEVAQYARYLGLDERRDVDLLWIVRNGLTAPLPSPWRRVVSSKGGAVYYFNKKTGESQWVHPNDALFRQLIEASVVEKAHKQAQLEAPHLTTAAVQTSPRLEHTTEPVRPRPPPPSDEKQKKRRPARPVRKQDERRARSEQGKASALTAADLVRVVWIQRRFRQLRARARERLRHRLEMERKFHEEEFQRRLLVGKVRKKNMGIGQSNSLADMRARTSSVRARAGSSNKRSTLAVGAGLGGGATVRRPSWARRSSGSQRRELARSRRAALDKLVQNRRFVFVIIKLQRLVRKRLAAARERVLKKVVLEREEQEKRFHEKIARRLRGRAQSMADIPHAPASGALHKSLTMSDMARRQAAEDDEEAELGYMAVIDEREHKMGRRDSIRGDLLREASTVSTTSAAPVNWALLVRAVLRIQRAFRKARARYQEKIRFKAMRERERSLRDIERRIHQRRSSDTVPSSTIDE